jgi:uncharacterized protein (UPF0305 family)
VRPSRQENKYCEACVENAVLIEREKNHEAAKREGKGEGIDIMLEKVKEIKEIKESNEV